jgi:hypothetical protein
MRWLRREDLLPGTPFLISPALAYDVVLNGVLRSRADGCELTSAAMGWAG